MPTLRARREGSAAFGAAVTAPRRANQRRTATSPASERNVVVEVVGPGLGAATLRRATARFRRSARRRRARTEIGVARATPAAIPAAEELHAVGDDFRRVLLDAFLVRVLASLQTALNIDGASFLQVFAGDLGQASEQHDGVPFGLFLLFSALVLPRFRGGDAQVGDGVAAGRVARFRVTAEVADQNHFVHRGHVRSLRWQNFEDCTSVAPPPRRPPMPRDARGGAANRWRGKENRAPDACGTGRVESGDSCDFNAGTEWQYSSRLPRAFDMRRMT